MPYKEVHRKCSICNKYMPEDFLIRYNYRIEDRNRIIHGWKCKSCIILNKG